MTDLLKKINDYINELDTENLKVLHEISSNKVLKKGGYLLRQDQICNQSYFIEKGVVRKYYLNDGKEITTELLFENDIAVSFTSYTLQKPGYEFIQAVTDVSLSATDYKKFQKAKNEFPKLQALDLMMTEYYAIWLENRLFQFHTLTATERYLLLLKEQPHYIKIVPLTFIASYIGISLETLSRIRAKI
jgi:CRP-like cAMP-binding protein